MVDGEVAVADVVVATWWALGEFGGLQLRLLDVSFFFRSKFVGSEELRSIVR